MSAVQRAGPAISRAGSGLPSRVVIHGTEGVGKCLGKDTPVLMFDGSIKMSQDIEFGDRLMGPDSTPRTVLGVCSGRGPLYRVTPTKGEPYVVNEHHVLSLKMSRRFGGEFHRVVNMEVSSYLTQSPCFKRDAMGWRTGADWPEKELPIPPYLFGCWLGDGTASKPDITTPDAEVLEAMESYAKPLGLGVKVRANAGKATTFAMTHRAGGDTRTRPANQFVAGLKSVSVLSNKHVPYEYRAGSRQQRLELLAGVIDADGHHMHGCYDLVFKQKDLADGIVFVARSLGLAAYVRQCEKTCTNSPTRARGIYHRITISGHIDMIPVRIKRRLAKSRQQIKNVLVTGLKVEPIGEGEYFGFELDGDHLFLLGDFTVTHNSSMGAFAPKPVFAMTRGETGLLTLIDNGLVTPTDHFDESMAWSDLMAQVRWLIDNQHENRTFVLDTLNGAERLCFEHVTREKFRGDPEAFMAYGKGPEMAQAEWIRLLLMLDELRATKRMAMMLLCHTRIKTFRNPDGDDFDRYCFAGETLVATRDGLTPISSLAGKEVDLLVPNKGPFGELCEAGSFVKAPVTSRGTQRLWEIRLRRARSEMTIRATANHRWPLKRNYRHEPFSDWRTTAELQPGDTLRTLRNWPISQNGEPMPVAIMQGFTFGDGGKNVTGDTPCELSIYSEQKIAAMLPFFSSSSPKASSHGGSPCWRVYSLPRSWKELPDIRESRTFLLGWLAGWFAADGTVCERGYSTLTATPREHLEFARSVCSILGIRTGGIVEKVGGGFATSSAVHYELSLSGRDLPESFFLLAHHKERAATRADSREENPRDDRWAVVSVKETDQVEEVFCATVEGVGAFGLAGDLMTGNSPDMHEKVWGLTHKWADVVLFANFETFAKRERGTMKAKGVGGNARVLYTQRTAAYDAKNRLGLPAEIQMSGDKPDSGWLAFSAAMRAARQSRQANPVTADNQQES